MSIEGADADQPTVPEAEDLRDRCLADGYLPEHLEGLTEEDMAALLDYEVGSTPEAAAERLKHMTIWKPDTPSEEIVEYLKRPKGLDDFVDPCEVGHEGDTT